MTAVRLCPVCGTARIEDARFCGGCGADLEALAGPPKAVVADDPVVSGLARVLGSSGFGVQEHVPYQGWTFRLVGHRERIEATKFGKMAAFWVVGEFEELTGSTLTAFSAAAFAYALASKETLLPRGFGGSLLCFPVAVANRVTPDVPFRLSSAPPRHWSAFEFPVVVDRSTGAVYKFEGTPIWGFAYFGGFRDQVRGVVEAVVRDAAAGRSGGRR